MLLSLTVVQSTSLQLWKQLKEVLPRIPVQVYAQPIPILYKASIGQHCRHLIEFFGCICEQISEGVICYDARRRELPLEQLPEAALAAIEALEQWVLEFEGDWEMPLEVRFHPNPLDVSCFEQTETYLLREWWYAIDHAIHHLALFKVGLHLLMPDFELPAHFGVAPATVHYRMVEG